MYVLNSVLNKVNELNLCSHNYVLFGVMENLSLFFSPEKFTIKSNWNIYRKGESKIATVYPLVTKNRLDNAFEKNIGMCAS